MHEPDERVADHAAVPDGHTITVGSPRTNQLDACDGWSWWWSCAVGVCIAPFLAHAQRHVTPSMLDARTAQGNISTISSEVVLRRVVQYQSLHPVPVRDCVVNITAIAMA